MARPACFEPAALAMPLPPADLSKGGFTAGLHAGSRGTASPEGKDPPTHPSNQWPPQPTPLQPWFCHHPALSVVLTGGGSAPAPALRQLLTAGVGAWGREGPGKQRHQVDAMEFPGRHRYGGSTGHRCKPQPGSFPKGPWGWPGYPDRRLCLGTSP